MKKLILFICFFLFFESNYGQETVYKYYIHLLDYNNPPTFQQSENKLIYNGNDLSLHNFFNDYTILSFSQAFPTSKRPINLKVFEVSTTSVNFIQDLLDSFPTKFSGFEDITNLKYNLESYPDDYGITNPNGNTGANINRHDLDYINMSKAWDLTTGINTTGEKVTIGISDARIKSDDPDFINKISFINPYFAQSWPYNSGDINTLHGTQVAGIAAAQGNNGYGSTGVCYDCNIIGTAAFNYDNLLTLAQSGARVINMSWTGGYSINIQNIINEVVEDYNVVLVAAAGNVPSHLTQTNTRCQFSHWDYSLNQFATNYVGMQYFYPASFDGVISVSGMGHNYLPNDPAVYNGFSPLGFHVASFIKDSFSPNVNVSDPDNPIGLLYNGWTEVCTPPVSGFPPQAVTTNGIVATYTYNEKVDILAPGYTNFRFPLFAEESGAIGYYLGGGTSAAAPYVSGTAALMISINNCITPREVEDIIKLSSNDTEAMPINQNFVGFIGAGGLNAGDAVEFVNEMKKADGNAVIDNHIFNRFDYNLQKINNNLTIENVTFRDNCIANFTAKNQIHLLPNTNITPNTNGNVHLSINPLINITCSPANFAKGSNDSKNDKSTVTVKSSIKLYPNPNNGSFQLLNIKSEEFESSDIKLQVFDLNGRSLYKRSLSENDFTSCKVDLNYLSSGIYIVKLSSLNHSVDIKFIKN